MNTQQLLDLHGTLCSKARQIMEAKNHDYTGPSGNRPFANFEVAPAMGLASTEVGILIRITDKVRRLSTFATAGELKVKDESVQDTIIDLINYAVILAGVMKSNELSERPAPYCIGC